MADIAYQNKDVSSKVFAQKFGSRYLNVFGLKLPKVVKVLDTNLPAVKVNELRLDNLFEFEDGSVGIIDYESAYDDSDKLVYMDYHTRVMQMYHADGLPLRKIPNIRVIIIYTADVKRKQVRTSFTNEEHSLTYEAAFLSELPAEQIRANLETKTIKSDPLTDDEILQLIVLPLSYETREKKQEMIRKAVDIAKTIPDEDRQAFALSGILVFSSKVIDEDTYDEVRRMISMTRIGLLFEEEKKLDVATKVVELINGAASGFNVSVEVACEKMGCESGDYSEAVKLLQKAGKPVPTMPKAPNA